MVLPRITDRFNQVNENSAEKAFGDENYQPFDIYIGEFRVDLLEAVASTKRWKIARHKVDSKANAADHRVKLPDDLRLTILISDDEVGTDDDNGRALVSGFPRGWYEKYNEFLNYAEEDQLVEVVTPYELHPSMMVTEVIPRPETSVENGMVLDIHLEGVVLTAVDLVGVDPSLIPKKRAAKKGKGKSASDTADGRKLSKRASTGVKQASSVLTGGAQNSSTNFLTTAAGL